MSARYLVRFDDICPTMNWAVWERVEALLLDRNIRPMVAVVPDNRDPHLQVAPAREDFWSRVREWQQRGWTIGWHGFTHVYESADPGLVGLNRRSEFAGVSREAQQRKLQSAFAIFTRHGVRPDLWIAPAHSFDRQTLELLLEFGVSTVSDGFFVRPVVQSGVLWIPQQLWRFRTLPLGVWTVCYHINSWSESQLHRFESDLTRYADRLIATADVLGMAKKPKTVFDTAFHSLFRTLIALRT